MYDVIDQLTCKEMASLEEFCRGLQTLDLVRLHGVRVGNSEG